MAARGVAPALIFSGQHPALDPQLHGLGAFDAVRLACPGQGNPHTHVAMVSEALLGPLTRASAELVMVQGDTSTALGGTLAANLAGIPVAHVEAGLRSHDLRSPWPEEEFRVAIDREADLLFAPTELSAANLRRERVRGRIHVTGNSGIDAALAAAPAVRAARSGGVPRLLVTCHRRENWNDGLGRIAAALKHVATEQIARVELILHPNPSLCSRLVQLLDGVDSITFRQPCGHSETLGAMLECDLVLSDSGGLQEEASALGVPLLVLRDRTERPEAIACGSIELVGTESERIVDAVRRRLSGNRRTAPTLAFGDGSAGERIAAIVKEWLREKEESALSPIPTTCPRQVGNW
ncbi:MAG: UDP-N-acetylglucosamine 2-epimerase (non-hydrolyzing) [Pseudomonadota bacterium]|nr:UDP-N-acetylglucosamine 2-epimerase (non-hydrolyzing) [Pseudomonadota bacterium]